MSDKVSDLEPDVQDMCLAHLAALAREGLLMRACQTRRTFEEQDALYAKTPKVTNAPAGYSWHNFGRAYDLCFTGADPFPDNDDLWKKVADIGESCGMSAGFYWKHPDRPHFEHTGGQTLAQRRDLAKAEGLLA